MSAEQAITEYRPLLYAVAYRILGVASDAEDMVQETFLKIMRVDLSKIEDIKNYLIKTITNTCLNHLEALKRKKEHLVDNWSNITHNFHFDPFDQWSSDKASEISEGLRNMMKRLNDSELGVYLLKEAFNLNYNEITEIAKKKADHCRQLFHRSKMKLEDGKDKFNVDPEKHFQIFKRFQQANKDGEVRSLVDFIFGDKKSKQKNNLANNS
ncbi:sigma-70 family RNA polymerase sigma factor [Flammeovirga yaeyamensis]|uniref:Sigma-70 family RNA polymerase sigma factor n=1 Tax=Flammeovirga yaeyamensis TaxID=367791 RepID=A0AAX1MZ68_9BACT|nr:sigma-70 family RNA polymerase sigma factor [Flammeovirga yaeyamensis]MBB3696061.1 RNA polymerase sigma-70 factor (ECF subfamily) [Flammeovirga yaeyamensis]NMF34746.1 sigma-70 family RNA polymerase sigma factor [Flammeovirga yaeyamensis]QWG00426.1 sigma-70 family RNA polymerase sigma factor [Flammeovirga yaeyamensis]